MGHDVRVFKRDVIVSRGTNPGPRGFKGCRIDVYSICVTMRPHEARRDQRYLANPAAKFPHTHACRDSGGTEKAVGEWVEHRSLQGRRRRSRSVWPNTASGSPKVLRRVVRRIFSCSLWYRLATLRTSHSCSLPPQARRPKGDQELGSMPILSLTASRRRCLHPRYRSVV